MTLLCGASKGFMKIFMKVFMKFYAFIKPFEAPQRSVKIKIYLIFSLRPGLGRKGLKTISFYLEHGFPLYGDGMYLLYYDNHDSYWIFCILFPCLFHVDFHIHFLALAVPQCCSSQTSASPAVNEGSNVAVRKIPLENKRYCNITINISFIVGGFSDFRIIFSIQVRVGH